MKNGKKIIVAILLSALMLTTAAAVLISADSTIVTDGEMTAIKSDFQSYLVQDTKRIENDGKVGAVQYTVYYDTSKGAVKNGYYGTPVIGYAINTSTARVGTDPNKKIIQSMLDRGYVVVVFDYLSNPNAKGQALDVSCQIMADKIQKGELFDKTASVFPAEGMYRDFIVVPSGYNVLLNQVFWEIDKHGTDGTLEKIVQNWNTDFKGTKAERLVKWVTGETVDTRKKVANASDGTKPVWYTQSGAPDENGLYTKVKYTVAETFTDCVNPDGSPLETNLNLQLAYPTNPAKEVPVLSIASCWGYNNAFSSFDINNAHSSGSMFNGYAYSSFDYLWVPMARDSSFGYYDGNLNTTGAVTGDHMNYSVHLYNDKLINTAAMRYLRYLALSDSETYKLDLDAFTVIGLSKGGWFSFLGEEVLQSNLADPALPLEELEAAIDLKLASFTPKKVHEGHTHETRYQAGKTESYEGGTYVGDLKVDGGEKQPWLTYDGKEILSGVQFTYASNGSQEEDVSEGHCPIYVVAHMYDEYGAAYGSANTLNNLSRTHNIPSLFFETPQPHTYGYGIDLNWDVDVYDAFFDFLNYYMQGAPAKVMYVYPRNSAGGVKLTEKIVVKFAGEVTLSEILANVTVKAGDTAVSGSWYSEYGDTEWTFVPDALSGNTEYTLTVSGAIKGKNGTALGSDYTASFKTENDTATALTPESGSYYNVTVPALVSGHDSFVFRFSVSNNVANIAALYSVDSVGATEGTLLGKVNLKGSGSYEIDVTEFASLNSGKAVTLYLKAEKASGEAIKVIESGFDGDYAKNVGGYSYSRHELVKIDENGNESETGAITAVKAWAINNEGRYGAGDVFYDNLTNLISYKNIIGSKAISRDDYGRSFTITLRVYDTVSRTLEVKLGGMTDSKKGTLDYEQPLHHVTTKAGEWLNITVPYVVYDTDYGFKSNQVKALYFMLSPSGADEKPIYIADLAVTETVTDITVANAFIASKATGKLPYKTPEDAVFTLMNGSETVSTHATWNEALSAYKAGYTLKMTGNYTLTDSDLWSDFGNFESVVVDLGGYTLKSENTKNSLIWAKNNSKTVAKTFITLKNGNVILLDRPLVSYENSSANGAGKAFDITLDGVYFTIAKSAMLTEMISSSTINGSFDTSVNINLKNCFITASEADRADHPMIILPKGEGSLGITYKVYGGNIRLDSQRWVAIHNNTAGVEFMNTEGGLTTLSLAAPYKPATDVSYIAETGYADFKIASVTDNIVTYNLDVGANSTKYGVIPEDKMNADKYPFVLFKGGSFLGAYENWATAISAWNTAVAGSAHLDERADLLMRRDYDNAGSTGGQINKATNLLLDFGGHKFTATNVAIDLWGRYLEASYTTKIEFTNGTVLTKGGGAFVDVQHDAAGVKHYDLDFTKMTFAFAEGATSGNLVFVMWTNPAGDAVEVDADFTDCTINLKDNAPSGAVAFPIKDGNNNANIDVTVNGGSFIVGNTSGVRIVSKNDKDTLRAGKGSDGNYPTLTVTGDYEPLTDNFLCDDGNNKAFLEVVSTGTGTKTYGLKDNPLATDFGVVDATYSDTSAYPYAVFTGGSFVAAKASFNDAFRAAVSKANSTSAEVQVVLRANNTVTASTWASDLNGKVRIDLGGYTLTSSGYLLDQYLNSSQFTQHGDITISSGTLVRAGATPLIGLNQGVANTATKKIDFTFEDLTVVDNFSGSSDKINGAVIDCWDNNNAKIESSVVFEDCNFDYGTAPTVSYFIGAGASKNYTEMSVTVKGGYIINSDMTGRKFAKLGTEDSISFEKGASGDVLGYKQSSSKDLVTTQLHGMYFVELEDDGVTSTSYLRSLTGDFGTVPHSTITANPGYLSALDYPFMLFRDGSFKFVENSWQLALAHAKDQPEGSSTTIILRRNYDTSTALNDGMAINFISIITANLTVDLQGNTLNCRDCYMFDTHAAFGLNKDLLDKPVNITVKNGMITNSRDFPIMNINHGANASAKVFSFTFDDVYFKDTAGKTSLIILGCWDNGSAGGAEGSFVFNNCTFDFGSAKNKAVMLDAGKNKDLTKLSITVNGGKIIASDIANYSFVTLGNEDSLVMGKGKDGNYLALTQLAQSAVPSAKDYKTADGTLLAFGMKTVSGVYATYTLGASVETKYGSIPFTYASKEEYPYQVFRLDGSHVGGYAEWGAAVNAAVKAGVYDNYIILMMRDADQTTNATIGNLKGSITVDMDGYTLSKGEKGYLIDAYVNGNGGVSGETDVRGTFTIKNGTIVKKSGGALICTNYGAELGKSASFTYNFDGVTFISKSGDNLIFCTWEDGCNVIADNLTMMAYVTFNGCVFDYASGEGEPLMLKLVHDGRDKMVYHVTVKGGKIIAKSAISIDKFMKLDKKTEGRYDTVTFVKDDGGNYPVFILPVSEGAPKAEFALLADSETEQTYVLDSSDETNATYKLMPRALVEYQAKSSITLSDSLVYNIYIPKSDILTSIVLDGEEKDLSSLPTDTEAGKEYYLLKVILTSYDSLRDIVCKVTLIADGAQYDGSITVGVFSYAKSIIEGEYTESEKALAKDLLSYVRASYGYFGKTSEQLALIDDLLGESYDEKSAPDTTPEAKTPEAGSGFTGVTFKLGSAPAFRFYYEGAKPEYSFKLGGADIAAKDGTDENGKTYLEISPEASLLLDDLTFTAGEKTYTYNVYSYLAFITEKGDAEARALVLRLIKYCESAKAYAANN